MVRKHIRAIHRGFPISVSVLTVVSVMRLIFSESLSKADDLPLNMDSINQPKTVVKNNEYGLLKIFAFKD